MESKGLATTRAAGVTVEIRGVVCIGLGGTVGVDVVTAGRGDLVLIPLRLALLLLLFDSAGEELTLLGAFNMRGLTCEVCCTCRKLCIPCSY